MITLHCTTLREHCSNNIAIADTPRYMMLRSIPFLCTSFHCIAPSQHATAHHVNQNYTTSHDTRGITVRGSASRTLHAPHTLPGYHTSYMPRFYRWIDTKIRTCFHLAIIHQSIQLSIRPYTCHTSTLPVRIRSLSTVAALSDAARNMIQARAIHRDPGPGMFELMRKPQDLSLHGHTSPSPCCCCQASASVPLSS